MRHEDGIPARMTSTPATRRRADTEAVRTLQALRCQCHACTPAAWQPANPFRGRIHAEQRWQDELASMTRTVTRSWIEALRRAEEPWTLDAGDRAALALLLEKIAYSVSRAARHTAVLICAREYHVHDRATEPPVCPACGHRPVRRG